MAPLPFPFSSPPFTNFRLREGIEKVSTKWKPPARFAPSPFLFPFPFFSGDVTRLFRSNAEAGREQGAPLSEKQSDILKPSASPPPFSFPFLQQEEHLPVHLRHAMEFCLHRFRIVIFPLPPFPLFPFSGQQKVGKNLYIIRVVPVATERMEEGPRQNLPPPFFLFFPSEGRV